MLAAREVSDAYDRLVAKRPSDEWQRRVDEEAAELARGTLSLELAPARHLWPESLRVATDAALAKFEGEVRALNLPSDEDILAVVKRLALTLNKINDEHVRSGKTGYETDERDELCDYINASLQEAGIDVPALETRHGAQRGDIAGNGATGSRATRGLRDRLGRCRVRPRPSDGPGDQRLHVRDGRQLSGSVHRRCCSG